MARASHGGAYVARGRAFMRITTASGERTPQALSWLTPEQIAAHDGDTKEPCPCRACVFAREVQSPVNRIREAGKIAFVQTVVEQAAEGGPGVMEELTSFVDGLTGFEVAKPKAAPAKADTFDGVTGRWTSGELYLLFPDHVRLKDSASDAYRAPFFSSLPLPPELVVAGAKRLGELPIALFTIEHAELVMRELDTHRRRIEDERAERANRKPKRLAPLDAGGRRQCAQRIHRTLGMSVYPLQLIKVNPIPRGWLPRVPKKAKGIPYPDEERAALADTAHAIHWRVFFGALTRLGFRADEAASLTMTDVDVARGIVKLDENKTDDPRSPSYGPKLPGREWYGPSLMRALKWWRDTYRADVKDDEPFFIQPNGERIHVTGRLAERWQRMLETSTKRAGIHRPGLFRKTAKWIKANAHALRGMFVTYALANGMTETWVADRTGHKSSTMINTYRQTARTVHEAGLGDVAPLDVAIPEVAAASAAAKGP